MSDFQYGSFFAPFPTLPANEPQTCDRWKPTYPDSVFRPKLSAAQHTFPPQNLFPIGAPSTEGGSYIIPAGAYDLWQYLPLVGPLDLPPPPIIDSVQWNGTYPSRIDRAKTLLTAQQQAWAMDKFTAPTPVTVPDESWNPKYANMAPGKPPTSYRAPFFWMDAQWSAPPQPTETQQFRAVYPDKIHSVHRQATYVWGQPHFGYEVAVPVESWTGWYLDPPVLQRSQQALRQQYHGPTFVPDVTPAAPALSWKGVYPDRIWPRPQIDRNDPSNDSIFVADVTVPVPTLSARAIFPDIVFPLSRLRSGAQQAFFIDATYSPPTPVIVPSLSVAVYPDRVYGKKSPAIHPDWTAPNFVLDVTVPAPLLSWAPHFPDYIMRAPYSRLYWDVEFGWCFQFPLALFRPEWAVNSNQYLGAILIQPIDK